MRAMARYPDILGGEINIRRHWRYRHSDVKINSIVISCTKLSSARYRLDPSQYVGFTGVMSGVVSVTVGGETRAMGPVASPWPNGPLAGSAEMADFLTLSVERERLAGFLVDLDCKAGIDDFLHAYWAREINGAINVNHTISGICRIVDSFGPPAAGQARVYEDLAYAVTAQVIAASMGQARCGEEAPRAFQCCIDFIEAHLGQPISVKDVARAAGVSLRSTQLLFQRHAGASITGFIQQRRLNRARAMLQGAGPRRSVTAVALDCGFNHLSYFYRCYRAAFGEVPGMTRRD